MGIPSSSKRKRYDQKTNELKISKDDIFDQENFVYIVVIACPLCDKAKLILEEIEKELGIQYEEIDINNNDELTELYGLMIPVVEWQGEIVQYGQMDKEKLCQ